MRRLISVLLLCLLCVLPCGVGVAATAPHADQPLLNNIMSSLSQHASVRAEFTQARSNPALAKPQESSGKLLFVLGHGMVWQTTEPFAETLAMTGSHASRLGPRGFVRAQDARGVNQVSQMLQSLLAGKPDDVLRAFDVKASGSVAQWTLLFTPRQERVARVLGGITLTGDAFLEGIRIDMHDGSATDIHFTDTRDAGPLDALEKRALDLP
ncbi:MAG: outer membrane lipoprotein carrier protein LolA [Rhodanobacter sp.]